MKVCWAVPVRDKARTLPRTIASVLGQVCEPLEIIFSDQGSTDESLAIMRDFARRYDGKHKLRILECPETNFRGTPGLNDHINWIHNQSDADIFISSAADDMPLVDRAEKTIQAFRDNDPAMVVTAMFFMNEDSTKNVGLAYGGQTGWPTEDGWVKYQEVYDRAVGGSTTQSWTREFYEKIGGLQGVGSPDMVMPFLACLDKGCWYISKPLHCYVNISDVNNTGLEGVMRATTDEVELLKLEELCHMQCTAGIFTAAAKMHDMGVGHIEATNSLVSAIVDRAASWQKVRQRMAMERVQPMVFKT